MWDDVPMGRCPSCGKIYLFNTPSEKCCWCGKIFCKSCLPRWIGGFSVKTGSETLSSDGSVRKGPDYEFIGLCSGQCRREFWKAVLEQPLADIGTEIAQFGQNVRKLWHAAILHALSCTPHSWEATVKVQHAIQIETPDFKAVPLSINDDGALEKDISRIRLDFINRAYLALAENLEKCGRFLDAANIYSKKLKLYDRAKQLKRRHNSHPPADTDSQPRNPPMQDS